MNRRAPLRRGKPLEPGTPLRRASVKAKARSAAGTKRATGRITPRAPGEFTPRVKLLVRKRAGCGDVFDAMCEACGMWLGEKGGEVQHRDARGMGGSRDRVTNGPANAVLLCGSAVFRTGCHGACEDRDPHMHGMGFWLEEGQDPRTEPVMLHGAGARGGSYYLAADGTGDNGTGYQTARPEVRAA